MFVVNMSISTTPFTLIVEHILVLCMLDIYGAYDKQSKLIFKWIIVYIFTVVKIIYCKFKCILFNNTSCYFDLTIVNTLALTQYLWLLRENENDLFIS